MLSKLREKLRDLPVAVKVTAWYTLLMTLILVAVMGFTVKFTEDMRLSGVHNDITEKIEEAMRRPQKFKGFDDGVFLAEYDADGKLVKGMLPPGMPPMPPNFRNNEIKKLQQGNQEFHYYDVQKADGTWMRGAVSMNKTLQRSQRHLLGLMVALPFFIGLAALVGYRIIKRGFRPVREISDTVTKIGNTKDLSTRIDIGPGGDEIHNMANTFNTMLDKVEGAVIRERRFSSDVSHELRTPVAIIMSESEYGKDFTGTVEEAKEGFASIFKQTQNMSALINQILELARMEHSEGVIKEVLDFAYMTEELLEDFRVIADTQGIKLISDIESGVMVTGNKGLLQRAVMNYLDNARKFTKDTIEVSLKIVGEKVVLAIADNGEGVSAENLTKIWDRLYQVDVARSKNDNTAMGLGLTLVQEIAKIHNGRAYAESMLGKGSIFFLEISLQS